MKQGYFIFFYCLLAFASGAQNQPAFLAERYSTVNGLTDNSTGALFQDSRGFLWIGSNNGLNRFDGKTFRQYSSFGKNGLTDLSVECITEDGDGNIWIGTVNGLNKLDPFTEKITHYYQGNGPGTIPYRWCNDIYTDKKKDLWLGTEKGIALYNKSTNSFVNYPVTVYGSDSKINKFIKKIFEDSKGNYWLATSYGVKLFDRVSKTYQSFHLAESPEEHLWENVVISIHEDDHGIIWAGTWGGGLLRFDEKNKRFDKAAVEEPGSQHFYIPGMAIVGYGEHPLTIVITSGKLSLLKTESGKVHLQPLIYQQDNKPRYLDADKNLSQLLTDKDGNIWLSGDGLYRIKPSRSLFEKLDPPAGREGKGNLFINHIIPDINNPGISFYITSPAGWWKYDAVSGSSNHILTGTENALLENINSWISDSTGYWFTSGMGFGYYDIQKNKVHDLSALIKNKTGQLRTGFLEKDQLGKIWVSIWRTALMVYDPVTQKTDFLFGDSTRKDNIFGMALADMKYLDGYIYCCVLNRFYKINAKDYSYKIISPPPFEEQVDEGKITPLKIIVEGKDHLFFSSHLRIYKLRNDSLITVFPESGLSSFSIDNIKSSPSGKIWASTSKGIFRTDTAFRHWIKVSRGLEEEAFSEIRGTSDGKILFTGMGNAWVLNESLLTKDPPPPAVMISSVKYGDHQVYLPDLRPVAVNSSYKDAIEIELSAIDFDRENGSRIIYQLQGWDKEWKDMGGSSVIRYEQLPPGTYVFRTKCINTSGEESRETLLHFTVIPPFYRTWWFIVLCVITTAVILYVIYRYRLRKALEMEKMRTRIATDLHDDIGATLSSISMYSQAVKSQLKEKNLQLENVLDKMGENSREMVNSISDIVWAINPENDDGKKLLQRMETYATDICAIKNITLHFEADDRIRSSVLPLEHRKNIYLIFKEAMNNSVKYSGAENIRVQTSLQGKKLALTISDDGSGFEEQSVKKGNGLKNMRARAKEIGGQLSVDAGKDRGTVISLNCLV